MTEKEFELVNIIRNHENPTTALITAISVISEFMKKDGEE